MAGSQIEALCMRISSQPDLDRKVEALVSGLADCLKSTSNDQNVQLLAREFRASSARLIESLGVKADA